MSSPAATLPVVEATSHASPTCTPNRIENVTTAGQPSADAYSSTITMTAEILAAKYVREEIGRIPRIATSSGDTMELPNSRRTSEEIKTEIKHARMNAAVPALLAAATAPAKTIPMMP